MVRSYSYCNIMAEGFRFMPLGLVKLRTFRLSEGGYLGVALTQVFTRMRGRSERITQRCHNSPGGKTGQASANDVKHRKARRILGILKKFSRVENWKPNEKG